MNENPIARALAELDGEPSADFVARLRERLLTDLARDPRSPSDPSAAHFEEDPDVPTYTAEAEPSTRRRAILAISAVAAALVVAIVAFAATRHDADRSPSATVPSSPSSAVVATSAASTPSASVASTVAATVAPPSTLSPTAARHALVAEFEKSLGRGGAVANDEYVLLHGLAMALPTDQFSTQRAAVDAAFTTWQACTRSGGACTAETAALTSEITAAASAAGD
jgi:hypothetical protein